MREQIGHLENGDESRARLLLTGAPLEVGAALIRYCEYGVETGGFLKALLSNDLSETFGRATPESAAAVPQLVAWVYNEAPGQCWGSPAKVAAWIERGEEAHRMAMAAVPDAHDVEFEDRISGGNADDVEGG